MARHSLYPGFIRLFYTSNAHAHVQVLPVNPSLSGSVWIVQKVLGGSYTDWTEAVDAWAVVLKGVLNTADTIDRAELYTMSAPDADPLFRAVYNVGVSGTAVTATVAYEQMVWTLRTDNGGLLKIYVMEGVFPLNYRHPYGSAGSTALAIWDFIMSGAGFIFGRDLGVPIAPIFVTTKLNDQLRKKYVLNA